MKTTLIVLLLFCVFQTQAQLKPNKPRFKYTNNLPDFRVAEIRQQRAVHATIAGAVCFAFAEYAMRTGNRNLYNYAAYTGVGVGVLSMVYITRVDKFNIRIGYEGQIRR